MKRLVLLSLTTSLPAVLPVAAQDIPAGDAYVLPEITLSAYQTEAELGRTGATVEIVTQEDLEQATTTRLVDYLATLPGISATMNGGFGTTATLRVRGLGGQYIKVLVDGIDVSDPSAPQISFDPGAMLTGDIARIEVLKGPQSALYGSEAIGGVISISTLDAVEPGTHQAATLEYGSYNTTRGIYAITNGGDDHAIAFTLQHLNTDGFSVADEADGNTEADGATATRATLSGRYDVTDEFSIGMAGFWQETETETDGDYPVLEDGADASNGITRGFRVHADYDTGIIRQSLSAQISDTSRQEVYDGITYPYDGSRTEVQYDGAADVNSQLVLAWGAMHSNEKFEGDGAEAGYITNSVFGELRYAVTPDLDVALSARHDNNSEFGGQNSGRVAVAWRPGERWILRAQYGTGYRAPSLYELYAPWVGVPSLEPETSEGGDMGVEYALPNGGFLRATAFSTVVTDLIDYSFETYTYAQFAGDTKTRGVELSGATPLGDRLQLSGNFTYTDATRPDGLPLDRVPARVLNLALTGEITEHSRAVMNLQYVSGTYDREEEMPSYTTVDLLAEYDITDRAVGYLRIENLLDEDYQVLRGYGTSGRAVFAGVRARF